jgi:hypothetical protein
MDTSSSDEEERSSRANEVAAMRRLVKELRDGPRSEYLPFRGLTQDFLADNVEPFAVSPYSAAARAAPRGHLRVPSLHLHVLLETQTLVTRPEC